MQLSMQPSTFSQSWPRPPGIAFALAVAYGMRRAYKWEANDAWERFARGVLLVGGAAYLAHLARDALTAKSLPLI